MVVATAAEPTRYTGDHLIAAQTILNRGYLAEIFTGQRAAPVPTARAAAPRPGRFRHGLLPPRRRRRAGLLALPADR
jgi:hypothetical protein